MELDKADRKEDKMRIGEDGDLIPEENPINSSTNSSNDD